MSDRYPGKLTIGGKLTADQLATLIDIIAMEGEGSLEYGDKAFEPTCKQDIIDALDEHTGHLVLCNDQARNGEFEQTEAALIEAGIAWERCSSAYCEYNAEMAWWHSGMKASKPCLCNETGDLLCPMEPVTEALEKLEAALNKSFRTKIGFDRQMITVVAISECSEARDALKKVVVEIPTLPKMEFV